MAINTTKEQHPQVMQRKYRIGKDIHGRKWGANIHSKTQDPVEPLRPHAWPYGKAPYMPAPKYMRWVYDENEGSNSVDIKYEIAIRDCEDALKEWNKELYRIGSQMGGQSFDPNKPAPEVLFRVGPKPMPREIPMAAQAGDPWILGLTDRKPAWAKRYFPEMFIDPLAFMKEIKEQEPAEAEDDDAGEAVALVPAKRGPGRPRKGTSATG